MIGQMFHSPKDLKGRSRLVGYDERVETAAESRPVNDFHIRPNSTPQYDFVSDLETYLVAAVGGIGSGKTTGLGFFIAIQMYAEMGSGTIGGIFANTYRQLEQTTLPGLWELFERMGLEDGVHFVYGREPPKSWTGFKTRFKKHTGVLSVRNWGQAVVRSLENFNSIRGLNLGWAAIDELRDARHEAFRVVLGRVRCPKARKRLIRIATSPCGFNWIYTELVENAIKMPPGSERRVISMPTSCNPDLPPEYHDTLRASFDGKYAQQELDGMFVSTTVGAVYHAFKRAKMVDPSAKADHELPFLVTFDFNRNPYCVEIAQAQPNGFGVERLVVLDEIVMTEVGTEDVVPEVAARIRALLPPDVRPVVEVYGDPAGNQKRTSASSNRSDYDIIDMEMPKYVGRYLPLYRRRSFPVMETVNAVNALMRRGGFVIHPRCRKTIKDLELVKWKEGSSEIDKESDRSLTHCSDGIRYLIGERYPIRLSRVSRIHT